MKPIKLDGQEIYPSKVVCIGRNYVDHIKELGNELPTQPVIFIKPNSAISADIHSGDQEEIQFEGEISFMVAAGALKAGGLPWERSKAFDGSAVFSDFVPISGNMTELRFELFINEHLVQEGGYELMLNKPDEILQEANSFLSFEDGDLIMTGTPKGVGQIYPGDVFTGKILEKQRLIVEASWVVK